MQFHYQYLVFVTGMAFMINGCSSEETAPLPEKPALAVKVITPSQAMIAHGLSANGSIAAWDEISISSEINGLPLESVLVGIGQKVSKGQLLATFDQDSVRADLEQGKANLIEAQAAHEEAVLNADRARNSVAKLAMSAQQVTHYLTMEKTAKARVASAQAQLETLKVRMNNTRVVAMDDGTLSARQATMGSVFNVGQELFRLIRQNRLEWRAEITAAEVNQVRPGQRVSLQVAEVGSLMGSVRMVAPTLDPASRHALVYVDLPQAMDKGFRSGMFARGEFQGEPAAATLLPQHAVLVRDGFHYLFTVEAREGDRARVRQLKVDVGPVEGEQIEIVTHLEPQQVVVASGVAFLNDGDWVKVVQE